MCVCVGVCVCVCFKNLPAIFNTCINETGKMLYSLNGRSMRFFNGVMCGLSGYLIIFQRKRETLIETL